MYGVCKGRWTAIKLQKGRLGKDFSFILRTIECLSLLFSPLNGTGKVVPETATTCLFVFQQGAASTKLSQSYPTEFFVNLRSKNPPMGVSEQHRTHRFESSQVMFHRVWLWKDFFIPSTPIPDQTFWNLKASNSLDQQTFWKFQNLDPRIPRSWYSENVQSGFRRSCNISWR